MSVVDNLTLDKANKALNKMKVEYETANWRLALIIPDRYEEVYNLIANHFVPDEPLGRSFGVEWDKEFENLVLDFLTRNISICMISRVTNEVLGVRVVGTLKSSDPPIDLASLQQEPLRNALAFLTHKNTEVDFMERYSVNECVCILMLVVNKKYRQMGIAGRIVAASVAMCRELGFKAMRVEGTSMYSQRIYEKQGFETIVTMPYESYMHKGRPLKEGTGEHTSTKIYGLRL